MKTLYLLRHAKAEAGDKHMSDADRPLAKRGIEACAHVGAYMKEKNYIPDYIVSSPSTRTRQTVKHIENAMNISIGCSYEPKLYLASESEIIRQIHRVGNARHALLVVGHNPGMHLAALALSVPTFNASHEMLQMKYPTAALAVLQFNVKDWTEVESEKGTLMDFVVPRDLDD